MQLQTPQKPTNPWTQSDLDSATARYQHAQTDLETFEQQIQDFPMYDWRPEIIKQHDALHRHLTRTTHSLNLIWKALNAPEPAVKSAKQSDEKVAPPEPKPPKQPIAKPPYLQSTEIRVVNGLTVTRVADNPAAFWLNKKPPPSDDAVFMRQLEFVDDIVPEEYAYVLEDKGVRYQPTHYVFLHYACAEFLRLCRLEIDTGSPHLLDGERLGSHRGG